MKCWLRPSQRWYIWPSRSTSNKLQMIPAPFKPSKMKMLMTTIKSMWSVKTISEHYRLSPQPSLYSFRQQTKIKRNTATENASDKLGNHETYQYVMPKWTTYHIIVCVGRNVAAKNLTILYPLVQCFWSSLNAIACHINSTVCTLVGDIMLRVRAFPSRQ